MNRSLRWAWITAAAAAALSLPLLLGACDTPGPTPPSPSPPVSPRILALGDSYTIGVSVATAERWPHQLAAALDSSGGGGRFTAELPRYVAQNGWRTDNLLGAVRAEAPGSDWDLVTLLIGVNDYYQGRPVSEYDARYPGLLDTAIALAGDRPERVLAVSIPDYAYTPFGQGTPDPAAISAGIDTFNAHAARWAERRGVRFLDITGISREGLADPGLVAGDGLHPSGAQYGRWVREVLLEAVLAMPWP